VALGGLTAAIAPTTPLARVQGAWEKVAGPALAQAAQPTGERAGVLTVTCAAAVWAHELSMMEHDLLARLNAALGDELLRELRCRTR
jgi:predicted nucleic acid-binding Zn ribbon protein